MKQEAHSISERVLIVHVNFSKNSMKEDVDELRILATSAGADVVETVTTTRTAPDAKYFVGLGKIEEIRDLVSASNIELVIFNHVLTPGQERNIEKFLKCRVIDRTGLILDIFAQRARSFEGKLQVELAQLTHLSTRLVKAWTHLERQRGGIGLRGGPGETQLEVDKRLIRDKIKIIKKRLEKIREQREQSRRARHKARVPTIALVGYTNAGKSTLFNKLTGGDVYVADQLFATLDPTLRRAVIKEIGPVIFADTVGFIRHLPHDLVQAFYATLEEVSQADLLLHVVDGSDADKNIHIEQVEQVLGSIKADKVPRLLVYNKMDAIHDAVPSIERDSRNEIIRVMISAKTGAGISLLKAAISESIDLGVIEHRVFLSPAQAKLRAYFYEIGAVQSEKIDPDGNSYLTLRLASLELEKAFPISV